MYFTLFAATDNGTVKELQMHNVETLPDNDGNIREQVARLRAEELAAPGTWNKVIELFELMFPGV